MLGGSILAFFWAPDGKTIAAIEVAAPGRRQASPDAGTASSSRTPFATAAAGPGR